ncbi:MAG: hypothetical protein DHS20C02_06940 [Micavibrio sp.]|nr:MAG: hypothetical protein DHS20C02_06940 [Micavibrio sp.]
MRKFFLILLTIVVVGAGGIPLALSFYLPSRAEQSAIESLSTLGFKTAAIQKVETRRGKIILRNIKLDDKGFSTAESITAEYSWTGFLSGGLISSLTIDGLSLTGESKTGGEISIAGWDHQKGKNNQSLPIIKTINVQNGSLDLLLASIGGVNLKYDVQLRNTLRNGTEFKGTISGTQSRFSADAKIKGNIKNSGMWNADLEVEQGKIDLPTLKASRISGTANMSGAPKKPPEFIMELAAGGVSFINLPWHSVSATINGNTDQYTMLATGESVGQEGIEFTLNLPNGLDPHDFSGSVYTQKLSHLFQYLKTNRVITEAVQYPPLLDYIGGLSLDFQTMPQEQNAQHTNLSYGIRNENDTLNIKGSGQIDHKEKTASGTLSMPSTLLGASSKGSLLINGEFQTDFSSGDVKTNGFISTTIKDATLALGPLDIKDVSGAIVFDDLSSFSTARGQKISFSLPLKDTVKQNGQADISVQNGKNIVIDKATLKLFDGKISATPIILGKEKDLKNFILSLSGINLKETAAALDIKGLLLEGQLKGALPLKTKEGKLFIKDGLLKNSGPGTIRFTPSKAPDFLQGDDLYLETARMALENYHYEFFEMRVDGPLEGETKIVINARGYNPDLFEKRPIALNLNIEAPLRPLFRNIFEGKKP